MQTETICKSKDWVCVSTVAGEAIISSQLANNPAIVRAKSLTSLITPETIVTNYFSEFDSGNEFVNTSVIGPKVWTLNSCVLKDKRVAICAWCVDGTFINVLEVLLNDISQVTGFLDSFNGLVTSIDFSVLRVSFGELQYDEHSVKILYVRGAGLLCNMTDNNITIVGKDKYFAISISSNPEEYKLIDAVSDCNVRVVNLYKTQTKLLKRIELVNDNCVVGTAEFVTECIGDLYVRMLGYWDGKSKRTLDTELSLEVN